MRAQRWQRASLRVVYSRISAIPSLISASALSKGIESRGDRLVRFLACSSRRSAESQRWSRLRAAVRLPIIIRLEAAQCGGVDVRHGPEAHPGARPVQQVEAFAGRRCGTAVLQIRNRPDEQIDDMLVVVENQSADDAIVNVIEPTA